MIGMLGKDGSGDIFRKILKDEGIGQCFCVRQTDGDLANSDRCGRAESHLRGSLRKLRVRF